MKQDNQGQSGWRQRYPFLSAIQSFQTLHNFPDVAAECCGPYHIIFVLHENAEFLQERYNQDKQLKIITVQGFH